MATCRLEWAVAVGLLGGTVACAPPDPSAQLPTVLTVTEVVHHLDIQNREPMLARLPDGDLFVTGFPRLPHRPPRAPSLWHSADDGQTWRRVPVGEPDEGALGNSDTDLAVGPDGHLYFITMGFDRTAREGTHVTVGVSPDAGATWSWTMLSETRRDDRPWIELAPDGTAHAIWNDGNGISHAVSTDRGATWEERDRIHPRGGSSHLAVGGGGLVAVRITPASASGSRFDEDVDLIAISEDAGGSWRTYPAPGQRTWPQGGAADAVPRWVEPLAWDADGYLYHVWSEGSEMKLGRSLDRGQTWRIWTLAAADDALYYPYLIARGQGELAATFFSAAEAGQVQVVWIQAPDAGGDGDPHVVRSEPLPLDSWQEDGERVRDPAGEYVPVVFLPDGGLGVVTPLQDPATDRYGFSFWRLHLR